MTDKNIDLSAERLLAQNRLARQHLSALPLACRPQTENAGYAVQDDYTVSLNRHLAKLPATKSAARRP